MGTQGKRTLGLGVQPHCCLPPIQVGIVSGTEGADGGFGTDEGELGKVTSQSRDIPGWDTEMAQVWPVWPLSWTRRGRSRFSSGVKGLQLS